ncbi:MAG: radical SAM protein, partial [Anaerolineales bacterium]|nr:radical SAM protein [Anaerolineales bacterium]
MQRIRSLFQKVERLQPGIYHYQSPPEDPRNYRLHLRVEPDGQGVLVVNASTILHLNQTAAEFAYHLVQDTPEEQAVQDVVQRYRVSRAQAQQDFQDFRERLEALIAMPDLDPVTFLDFERAAPYERPPSAPYRLDCALTYRLPPEANPEFTPTKRVERELTAQEWMAILDKAWQAGIPHVIFTGGEPTLREDLFEFIRHAEQNGQVSGLISDGQRLLEAGYLDELLRTGLDHLMILLDVRKETSWKALAEASSQDLFTSVLLTVDTPLAAQLPAVLGRLAQMKPNA